MDREQNTKHLESLRETHQKRLHILELQAARFGPSTPPEIQIEIEDIHDKINSLDSQLKNATEQGGKTLMIQTDVLAIFANPRGSDPLRLENEDRVIHECVERSKYRSNISLKIKHAARIDDFARSLLEGEYKIVQFSGHGAKEGLAFENELGEVQIIPKDALSETLSDYSPPIECVILNACYSNIHNQKLSVGVPYTISMNGAISDKGATEFTRGFYDAIGAGKDIEFAYKEGCRRIKLKGFGDANMPVLVKRENS